MHLKGCATLEGTAHFRERFHDVAGENHFHLEQNLWLSSIGVGTYLGEADEETDQRYSAAIVRAVELGANVIDTAANYRFQRSEKSIGVALGELTKVGYRRDEIVVCSKGGYLPFDSAPSGDVRQFVKQYIERTFVKPGIASFADIVGGVHCMTPRYLQNQLDQSLANMGLDCIDVYYVHNPESQLSKVSPEEFWQRLRAAFELLEQNVADGKIKKYGAATWNGFRAERGSRDYHSLESMVEVAREVAGDNHHFGFIQLPFNLGMTEALFFQNQKLGNEYVSVLEVASALGITVMASASILQGRVSQRLSGAVRESLGSLPTAAQAGIQFVRAAPGVATALVGMSQRAHVEENLQLVPLAPMLADDFKRVFAGE